MQKSKVDYDEIASRVSEVSLVADALEIVQSAYCIDFVTYHLVTWNQSKPHFVQLLSQEQEFVLWLAGRRTSSF